MAAEPSLSLTSLFSTRRNQLVLIFAGLFLSALIFIAQISSLSDANTSSSIPVEQVVPAPVHTVYVELPAPPAPPPPPPPPVEPVVFSLIMWSQDSALEGALLLKTIIMYTSKPVDIHIICDDEAENVLRSRLALLTQPRYTIRVIYHKPTWQSMLDRVDREGSLQTDHSAGIPGLMKLFIHEILPSTVTKAIFVDTDAIFITDPVLLWETFDSMRPETAIAMASHPDQNAPEWHHASRICSCVMLLHLEKLRQLPLMDSKIYREKGGKPAAATEAFRAMYGEPTGPNGKYDTVRLGDQGYWWAIVDHRRDLFEPMSFDFEVTSCLLDTYMVGLGDELMTIEKQMGFLAHVKDTPQEGTVVLPKLLHFNCLHGSPLYMNWPGWSDPSNALNVRWGPALRFHNGYKWIWLNQGRKDAKAKLEMTSIPNVVFLDELSATPSS